MKAGRPSIYEYYMSMAVAVSKRSVCLHRQAGAVIVKDNRSIIATGYNGPPADQPHCSELGTCGKDHTEDKLRYCRAEGLHAESNAIISAARLGVSTDGTIMYCIYSPCLSCCNMIKNAGIQEVIYMEVYESWPGGDNYLNNILDVECSSWLPP